MVGSFRELRDRLRSPAAHHRRNGEVEKHRALEANGGVWHSLLPAPPSSPDAESECITEWVEALFTAFPLYWQRRHSRYLCQLSAWAKEREDALFLFTSTSFFRDAANPSLIVEEFQFELSHTVEAFDRDTLGFLLEDVREANIATVGPNRVVFGPLKIIAIETQFQLLKALVEWCVREPSETSNRLLKSLITLLQNHNLFFQFFNELLREQLSVAGELQLFRETNTPPAKLLQQYLLLHGSGYLSQCIAPLLRKTAKKAKEYEINPILLGDSKDSVADRVEELEGLAGTFLEAIFASHIPAELTVLCASIKSNICKLDQGHRDEEELNRLSLAAGFFLHFLCPACVSPSLAGLSMELPTNAQRGLILCAKLFQMLANGNHFEVGYMTVMNPFLDRYQEPMRRFCTQVVQLGERHLPFVFESSRPSSEFMDWWALYLFLVRHRDSLGEVLDEQNQRTHHVPSNPSLFRREENALSLDPSPASEKLARKLVVITDHVANLNDQYPYYWSRSGRFDQAHKEEWSEWETIWENEKQGKKTAPSELPVRVGAVPATINPLYQQPVPTARPSRHRSVLTPVSSTSTIQARKSFSSGNHGDPLSPPPLGASPQPFLMIPHSQIGTAASPPTLTKDRDSLANVLTLSPSEPSTRLQPKSPSSSSSKRRKSRTEADEDSDSRSLNPFRGQAKRLTRGIASASSSALEVRGRRASTGSADTLQSFAAPEQLSSSELKKGRKQFQAYLEDIRDISSPLPLYIDHDARIQSHLRLLFSQVKSSFHNKTHHRLEEWHNRFEHPLTLYCRKLYTAHAPSDDPSSSSSVDSFYPAFGQSLIDLRDTLLLDLQGQYPLLAQLEELSASCVVVVERFTFGPVYPFIKHFYRERFQAKNEQILKNVRAGKHAELLQKSMRPLQSKNKDDYLPAVQELQKLSRYAAPTEKIFCIRKFLRQVFLVHLRLLEGVARDLASLESYCFELSSEELLPVLLFAMGSAKLRHLYSEMQLLSDLAFPSTSDREIIYYLALFQLCVQLLAGDESPDSLQRALAHQVQLQADDHKPSPEPLC